MDNKSLRLHKIILAIEIGIVSLIIVLKLVYYISKFQDGFFESVLDFVIWTTVSVFISLPEPNSLPNDAEKNAKR